MKTKDALAIGIKLGRLQRTLDAWEESKHPRANNGQFSHSAGGGRLLRCWGRKVVVRSGGERRCYRLWCSDGVGACRRQALPGLPEGMHGKNSDTALTSLEMSDGSFVRHSSRPVLLIAGQADI